MSDSSEKNKPPYVPFGTFKNFVEGFREDGLPHVIDRSLMQNFSGTVQSMLTSALRSMGFIAQEGAPTDRFKKYISGGVLEQREALREGLGDCYHVVLSHETPLNRMTQGQFDKALREEYGFTASTLDKAASFFLAACTEADIEVGNHLKKRKATATRNRKTKAEKPNESAESEDRATDQRDEVSDEKKSENDKPLAYRLLDLLKEPDFADEHKTAAWQLIQYLMEREKQNMQRE